MFCRVCGECREDLDDNDTCADCREEEDCLAFQISTPAALPRPVPAQAGEGGIAWPTSRRRSPRRSRPCTECSNALKELAESGEDFEAIDIQEEIFSCSGLADAWRDLGAFTRLESTAQLIARGLHEALLELEQLEAEMDEGNTA
jgi:hypothetical protein